MERCVLYGSSRGIWSLFRFLFTFILLLKFNNDDICDIYMNICIHVHIFIPLHASLETFSVETRRRLVPAAVVVSPCMHHFNKLAWIIRPIIETKSRYKIQFVTARQLSHRPIDRPLAVHLTVMPSGQRVPNLVAIGSHNLSLFREIFGLKERGDLFYVSLCTLSSSFSAPSDSDV